MTDLEITKACAEAMEIDVVSQLGGWHFPNTDYQFSLYDPLHDDAQVMALVKKFGLHIVYQPVCPDTWLVDNTVKDAASPDLNRAICECVYKLHTAKRVA